MKNAFGGSLFRNKRKSRRVLDFDKATHTVLRLRPLLPPFFDPHDHALRFHFFRLAQKYNIRVYDLIFNHTHMHATLLLPDRPSYVRFIREMAAFITHHFSKNLEFLGGKLKSIFSNRPFTRVVPWGRAYEKLKIYMRKNEMESRVLQRKWNEEQRRRSPQSLAQLEFEWEYEFKYELDVNRAEHKKRKWVSS